MDDEVSILLDQPRLRLGARGPVVIAHWFAPPTAAEMRQMRVLLRPWVSKRGAFCALNIVDIQHVEPMGDEAREEVAQTQREFQKSQRGLANVIEGAGFWAASLRSVAAGLAFLSRVGFEQRPGHPARVIIRRPRTMALQRSGGRRGAEAILRACPL
jgi:hypothetical protein